MKIPEKVKIGGYEYVVETKEVVTLENSVCYGTHSFKDLIIEISSKYSPQVQEATLLHEALHAISEVFGIGLEESAVNDLANGLYAFIKDNPDIFR